MGTDSDEEEFGDDAFDYNDPALFELPPPKQRAQQRQPPAAAPPPPPPIIKPIQPRQHQQRIIQQQQHTILRKPISGSQPSNAPPVKKPKVGHPAQQSVPPPPKPHYSKAGPSNPIVHPNPFHKPPQVQQQQRLAVEGKEEDEDDDLPEIRVEGDGAGNGLYTAVTVPTMVPQARPVKTNGKDTNTTREKEMDFSKLKAWGGDDAMSKEREKERDELRKLRAERDKLQHELHQSTEQVDKLTAEVAGKAGEVAIVRRRQLKSEEAHSSALEEERKLKKDLENRLQQRENEYRRELEALRTENAFKRMENETTRRGPHSAMKHHQQTPSSASASAKRISTREGSMGPPKGLPPRLGAAQKKALESPSKTKGSNTSLISNSSIVSKPSLLPGFKNSFDSPHLNHASNASAIRRSPSTSLATPKKVLVGKGYSKGKEKAIEEEEDGEEDDDGVMMLLGERGDREQTEVEMDVEVDGGGADDDEMEVDLEGDEEGLGAWDEREQDWRGEILSAIFSHTTYQDPTSSSSGISVLHHALPTASHASSSSASRPGPFASSSTYSPVASSSTFRPQPTRQSSYLSSSHSTNNVSALPIPSPGSNPLIPIPTFHLLTNLRLSSSIPLPLQITYEKLCRSLFSLLGQIKDSSTAFARRRMGVLLGRRLEDLVKVLEEMGLVEALGWAVEFCVGVGAGDSSGGVRGVRRWWLGGFDGGGEDMEEDEDDGEEGEQGNRGTESHLLRTLGRIIVKYGQPGLQAPQHPLSDKMVKHRERERKRLLFKNGGASKSTGAGTTGGVDEDEKDKKVVLEKQVREDLLRVVGELVETLVEKMEDGDEDALAAFVEQKDVIATLLEPAQPTSSLITTIRTLSLLACRPALFSSILGVKFYDRQDMRGEKVPIFERLGTLLAMNTPKGSPTEMFTLDHCLIGLASILSTKHADSLRFLTQSPSFIPELLDKVFKDVRTVWEYDGLDVSESNLSLLKSVVARLSSSVHLFYYLACSVSSTFNTAEFFAQSGFVGLDDRFIVAFGTLAFGTSPDWAKGIEEGRRLTELGYLATEILDDMNPNEVEDVESCFLQESSNGLDNGGHEGDEDERQLREAEALDEMYQ